MTKRTIRNRFIGAIIAFVILLIAGILISIFDCSKERIVFSTFKDLLPLFLGIAAIWLGYCVQRRNAYQQQLRSLWSKLVEAVNYAIQYSCLENPTYEQYITVLTKLSIAIDEVRGVFCNLRETNTDRGLYPFEPIKDMYGLIEDIGFGTNYKSSESKKCHDQIFALWKDVRKEILKEFDREIPTFSHSHWEDLPKSKVYDQHEIPKKPT
jgi:hypothetical protein